MADTTLVLFTNIGLTEQKAKETLKNEALSKNLKEVIDMVRICNWCNPYYQISPTVISRVSLFKMYLRNAFVMKFYCESYKVYWE